MLLLCSLLFAACAFVGCAAVRESQLKCGVAETVITPGVKDRPEVYGELYARALVLVNGDQRAALVTLDLGSLVQKDSDALTYAYSDLLLGTISKGSGIPVEDILVNTSQTHNAPGADDRRMTDEQGQWLANTCAELVKKAVENLQPATLKYGRAPAQLGYNRRLMMPNGQIEMWPNPKGAVVPWVDVLSAYDKNGKRIALVFSHPAHPVIVHWSSKAVGPDFPGYTITHLRNLLSKDGDPSGVFMFTQGCCGDINAYPLRGGYEACDAAGLSLAFAVTQALAKEKEVADPILKVRSLTIALPLQSPPPVDECKKLLAKEPKSERYQAWLKAAEDGKPLFRPFRMRAFAIGDVCVLGLPAEMFAEYQLWVEKVSPFKHNFVLSHTNAHIGYIGTKQAYEERGYETWGSPTALPPWLPPQPCAEQIIHDGILKLLTELKAE